jgi:hypothetical protein
MPYIVYRVVMLANEKQHAISSSIRGDHQDERIDSEDRANATERFENRPLENLKKPQEGPVSGPFNINLSRSSSIAHCVPKIIMIFGFETIYISI